MAEIEKGSVWAIFNGTEEEMDKCRELLTFQDSSATYTRAFQKKRWDGTRKLYADTKQGILFRAGIVHWVCEKIPCGVIDRVEKLPTKEMNGALKLRPYQQDALNAIKKKPIGVLAIPTSGGKTYVAAAVFMSFVGKKYLYIVHRAELLWQVYSFLDEFFPNEVGRLGAGFDEWNKKYVIAMIQTIDARLKKKKKKKADFDMDDVEVMIVDEAHHLAATTYKKMLDECVGVKVRVGLTGTPPDTNSMEGVAATAVLGETIYTIEPTVLIEGGYVIGPYVKMYVVNCSRFNDAIRGSINWKKFGAEKEYWTKARDLALVKNEDRNRYIVDLIKGKTGVLVLVDMIEHGKNLAKMIGCPFTWGGAEDRRELFDKFRDGKVPVLVSSPILDEGIDVSGIKVVVMASGGKSKVKLLQRVGRGMRLGQGKKEVEVIDFWDIGIKMLERHSRSRKAIYEKTGYPVEVVNEI